MTLPAWMDPAGPAVLAHLRRENAELTPAEVAAAVGGCPDQVGDCCRTLAEQGFVQPVGVAPTAYFVRELGVAFLDGELPPSAVADPATTRQ